MKRINLTQFILVIYLVLAHFIFINQDTNAQTFCTDSLNSSFNGVEDGYRYELWNQNGVGDACMTLGKGALFSGHWDGIYNYLARRGLEYDKTIEHQEAGIFTANYDCDYRPTTESGNSYLSVYGWTTNPLVEFYIVEDWRNWVPSMAEGAVHKGTIEVNGSVYDIVENIRVEQPSIIGTQTFPQIFSIRRDVRNSGSINITDHFNVWEKNGVDLGKLYEVSFVVEGYQSRGAFEFKELEILVTANGATEENDKKE